jgi:hypothetical protein
MRIALLLASLAVASVAIGLTAMAQEPQTWLVIEANGQERGGFVPKRAPYTQGGPTVGVYLFDQQNVRMQDGQALTGFEYLGWTEGTDTRVVVYALVPKEGAPNVYMPGGDAANLQRRDFATYAVASGQSQAVSEMRSLGIEPMVLRATSR